MREIKFRGKRLDNGKWAIGDLLHHNDGSVTIVTNLNVWRDNNDEVDAYGEEFEVAPATVGEYTGLKDEHGNEIYEGDIVLHFSNKYAEDEYAFLVNTAGIDPKHLHYYVVSWNNTEGGFGYVLLKELHINNPDMCGFNPCLGFLVGNIHDNPELLKDE